MAVIIWLSVQSGALDVYVFGRIILRNNSKGLSAFIRRVQPDHNPRKHRAADLITRITRTYRMKPAGGKHIPGRHLPDVLVPYQSVDPIMIRPCANLPRP